MNPGMKTQRLKAWAKKSKVPKRLNPAYNAQRLNNEKKIETSNNHGEKQNEQHDF